MRFQFYFIMILFISLANAWAQTEPESAFEEFSQEELVGSELASTYELVGLESSPAQEPDSQALMNVNPVLEEISIENVEEAESAELESSSQDSSLSASDCFDFLYSLLSSDNASEAHAYGDVLADYLFILENICQSSLIGDLSYEGLLRSSQVSLNANELLGRFLQQQGQTGIGRHAVDLPPIQPVVRLQEVVDSPALKAILLFSNTSTMQGPFGEVYRRGPMPVEMRNLARADFTEDRIDQAVDTLLTQLAIREGDVVVVSSHGTDDEESETPYLWYGWVDEENGLRLEATRILDAIQRSLTRSNTRVSVVIDACHAGRTLALIDGTLRYENIDVVLTTSSIDACAHNGGFVNALLVTYRDHSRQESPDTVMTFQEFLNLYSGHYPDLTYTGSNYLAATGYLDETPLMRFQPQTP